MRPAPLLRAVLPCSAPRSPFPEHWRVLLGARARPPGRGAQRRCMSATTWNGRDAVLSCAQRTLWRASAVMRHGAPSRCETLPFRHLECDLGVWASWNGCTRSTRRRFCWTDGSSVRLRRRTCAVNAAASSSSSSSRLPTHARCCRLALRRAEAPPLLPPASFIWGCGAGMT